jgi:hypothetical protein
MRTTNEPKTKTIKLRISEELASQIGEGNVSERVRELIRKGLGESVPQNTSQEEIDLSEYVPRKEVEELLREIEELKRNETVPQNNVNLTEIEGMTTFFDMSVEDFLHQVCERLNEGYVSIEGGKVVTYDSSGVNLERFKEVCHEKNIDVQKGMEKCVQVLMRG